VEADKKNQVFDHEQVNKRMVRSHLVQQAVLGNQDILQDKQWHKQQGRKQVGRDLQFANTDVEAWQRENAEVVIRGK